MVSAARILSVVLSLIFLCHPSDALASEDTIQFVHNGGFMMQDGIGQLQYREQELFIPASTLKILTCLVALENLGEGYQFATKFFLDEQQNLYIKGYGDPFLTSEVVFEIGKELAELGITQLDSLYLDESSFALNGETAGGDTSTNPYDAPNGALVVNFNALPVLVGQNGTITSGEPQTPIIPLMVEMGTRLKPGFHRVNISAYAYPRRLSPALSYAGELFSAQLKRAGIIVHNSFSKKIVPDNLKPTYIHYGKKSLEEIIRACLQYSNNFIANQLFLACGAKDFGFPATWEKSRHTSAVFTKTVLGLTPNQIRIQEGSGLSRNNRISPATLLKVLDRFKPYSSLLTRYNNILGKTGTLNNVFCYAGYFPKDGKLTSFAILLNQPQNTRDSLMEALRSTLN